MIKWGIIGAGNIANRFIVALEQVENASIEAIACRSIEKAKAFALKYDVPHYYDQYQSIIKDSNIDAIYIALPHGLHFEWAKKAIIAKKAVLVEKPAVMTSYEAKELSKLANENQVFFMEAAKTLFVPAYRKLKEILDQEIGEIKQVDTIFCHVSPYQEGKYHYSKDQGGCMLDIGIYNLMYIADLIEGYPQITLIDSNIHKCGVEVYIHAKLQYPKCVAHVYSAFDRKKEDCAIITGNKGSIKVSPIHRPTKLEIIKNDQSTIIDVPYVFDDFYSQIQHATDQILDHKIESPIATHQKTITMIQIINDIKAQL